jgi:hypothetical protein
VLSESSIAAARRVVDRFFTSTATVVSKNRSADGIGGKTRTVSDGASYPARLVAYDSAELSESDRIAGHQFYRLYLPHDAVLSAKQDVRVDGTVYRVEGFEAPFSSPVLNLCAKVAKIDGA